MVEQLLELDLWKRQLGVVPDHVWDQVHLETLILADNQRDMAMRLDAAGVTLALDARWPGDRKSVV